MCTNRPKQGQTPSLVGVEIDLTVTYKTGKARDTAANAVPLAAVGKAVAEAASSPIRSTLLYCFYCDVGGEKWIKIGSAVNFKSSYGSKSRFCPFVTFNCLFVVRAYGRALEQILFLYMQEHRYLKANSRHCEWFVGEEAWTKITAFVDALRACTQTYRNEQGKILKKMSPSVPVPVGFEPFTYEFEPTVKIEKFAFDQLLQLFVFRVHTYGEAGVHRNGKSSHVIRIDTNKLTNTYKNLCTASAF